MANGSWQTTSGGWQTANSQPMGSQIDDNSLSDNACGYLPTSTTFDDWDVEFKLPVEMKLLELPVMAAVAAAVSPTCMLRASAVSPKVCKARADWLALS